MKKMLKVLLSLALCLSCISCLCACEPTQTGGTEAPPKNVENVFSFTSSYNLFTRKVTVNVFLSGDAELAGVAGTLPFDPTCLTYDSHKATQSGIVITPGEGSIGFAYAGTQNLTKKTELFSVTFTYLSAPLNLTFTLDLDSENVVNADLEEVPYTVKDHFLEIVI